jgi:eukaryotic-like serine/threonine-protein kinase
MEATDFCCNEERLAAFNQGRLEVAALEVMGLHLVHCPRCEAMLATLQDDDVSIVENLRRVTRPVPWADDPTIAGIESRAKAIPVGSVSDVAGTGPTDVQGSLATSPQEAVPSVLGPYQLLRKLGRGGMGTVYEAMHTRLRKRVAVKVLPESRINDSGAVARFYREMEALGGLAHPNIVSATDAGEAGGRHYLAMEYVDGLDLAALVRLYGPPSLADAAEVIRQAATGLQYVHEHKRVHRDIKPANLMLSASGEVKILDLGLALLGENQLVEEELTASGQMMGTADYVAPEQWLDSHHVDIRADIYSLGCALYKLLTGRAPFSGPKYATFLQKRAAHLGAPVPPIADRGDLPEPFLAVLDRMLDKDPDGRFPNPVDVAGALEPFTSGCDLVGLIATARHGTLQSEMSTRALPRPPSEAKDRIDGQAPHRESRRAKRFLNWTYLALTTAVAVAAAGLVLAFSQGWQFRPSDRQPPQTPRRGDWQAIPDGEPIALVWPSDARNSDWSWKPELRELLVNCNSDGYIRLGETTSEDYQFEVSLYQADWGGAGIFFGYQPDQLNGQACSKCQLIQLWKSGKPGGANPFHLDWKVSQLLPDGGGMNSEAISVAPPEFGDQDQRLTITAEGGVLRSVQWNGVELMPRFLADPAVPRGLASVSADCRGAFGVFCGRSTVYFRNPRFRSRGSS